MSRIGKYPVIVPEGVTVTINGNVVTAKGKNGELKFAFDDGMVNAKLEENKVVVAPCISHNRPVLYGERLEPRLIPLSKV